MSIKTPILFFAFIAVLIVAANLRHIDKNPESLKEIKEQTYQEEDDIEGWSRVYLFKKTPIKRALSFNIVQVDKTA